ncbi:hypothetical protein ACOSP7_018960 [Xanthoceras sorbifolium]
MAAMQVAALFFFQYNLYGFVWDVVQEQLEPSDVELTQSYYEDLMDVPNLAQDIADSRGTDVADHPQDIHIGDAGFDPGQDSKQLSSPPPLPLETKLMRVEQKLMDIDARLLDVDARLQSFIIKSRESERRDEQYKLIIS